MTDLYTIPDSNGGTFLTNVNAAFQSAVKRTRRASPFPDTIYAGQLWDDSSNGLEWRRSQSGVWKPHGPGANTLMQSRSSNTVLGLGDHETTIVATGTFTQTFDAVATLTDGWRVKYRNDGTGRITLDPNSTEQIDGATTIVLERGESCIIECDGSALKTIGRPRGWKLVDKLSASSSAALAFTQGLDGTYDRYALILTGIIPATNATDLWLRVSEDGGSTWKQATNAYNSARQVANSVPAAAVAGNSDTKYTIAGSASNISTTGVDAELYLSQPSSTARYKSIGGTFRYYASDGNWYSGHTGGNFLTDAGAINGLQISMSSGNIATGEAALYGLVK